MVHLLKDLSSDLGDETDQLRQVIVNTHSLVLIGKLIQWEKDSNVSVWLCNQHSYIDSFNDKKYKVRVTRTSQVIKRTENGLPLSLFPNEQEKNLTLSEVKKILESLDTEKAKIALNG
jgi:hypothetical protein